MSSDAEFRQMMFLREIMHTVNNLKDASDILQTYPADSQAAQTRLNRLLWENCLPHRRSNGATKRSTNPAAKLQDQYSLRAPPGARTLDTLIKSQVLFQLS